MSTTSVESRNKPLVRGKNRRRIETFPYLLILPSALLILVLNIYPFISGFWYSLQNGTLIKPGQFVGLDNYVTLLGSEDFLNALQFSTLFAFFAVFGSWAMGLALALLLNKDMPGRGFFRVALLLPWILPSIVSIVSWRWLINDQNGLVNVVLGWFGVSPIYFLSTGPLAIFSVIVVKIWRSYPFMMLSILAALQNINTEMYEAASIDGASRWQKFRFLTLPMILNLSIVLWILMTIWSFNDFDTPWLLTGGGPSGATQNMSVLSFKYSFGRNDLGVGAANAFITLLILMVFAILILRRQRRTGE